MMKTSLKKLLTEYNVILVLLVIAICGVLWVPFFAKATNLGKLLAELSMYGIVAIGMTFLLISGEIDLSLGMSIALATIVSSLVGSALGGVWGVLAAVAACTLVGLVNGLFVTKLHINSLIVSIAMMTALTGICYLVGNGQTVANTSEFLRGLYTWRLFGFRFLQLPTVIFILCLIGFGILLHRTHFGTSVFVAGGNAEAGYMSGINIGRVKLICFIIAGICAGITGTLFASYVYAGAASYGEGLNITLISACVVGGVKFTGGKGGVIRTLLGITVVRAVINITSLLNFDAWAQNIVTGGLLLIVLIVDRCTREQKLEEAS